ncbi:glycogen debranching enzyme, partial [Streptomyces ardesiacus]
RSNNNAYCQDNELAWVAWPEDEPDLLRFTRAMVWLRKDHPVFRRRRFFHGRPVQGTYDELSDIAWFTPEGAEMTRRDWNSARASALTVFLNGNAISEPGARGERIADDSFLLMFNASPRPLDFVVPVDHGRQWEVVVDTALTEGVPAGTGPKVQAGDRLTLLDRSLTVLQRPV